MQMALHLRTREGPAPCSPHSRHSRTEGDLMRRPFPAFIVLGCCALLAAATPSFATPKGIPAGSKLAFNFNVIGYPATKTYDGNCGDGHRIFVNRDAKSAHVLVQNAAGGWSISDCNATSDHTAVLNTSDVATYDIYVRILGK